MTLKHYKSITEQDWQDFINPIRKRAETPDNSDFLIDISKPMTPEEVMTKINQSISDSGAQERLTQEQADYLNSQAPDNLVLRPHVGWNYEPTEDFKELFPDNYMEAMDELVTRAEKDPGKVAMITAEMTEEEVDAAIAEGDTIGFSGLMTLEQIQSAMFKMREAAIKHNKESDNE